jgi:hypothetical protein
MSTHCQIQANRLNAQKFTGPCTPRGKAISSQNSLRGSRSEGVPLGEAFALFLGEAFALLGMPPSSSSATRPRRPIRNPNQTRNKLHNWLRSAPSLPKPPAAAVASVMSRGALLTSNE